MTSKLHQTSLRDLLGDGEWSWSAVEVQTPKLVRVRRPRRVPQWQQVALFELHGIWGDLDNGIEPAVEKQARDIVGRILDRSQVLDGVPQSVSAIVGRAEGQGTGHERKLLTVAIERALDRFQANAHVMYGAEGSAVLTFGLLRKAQMEPDEWLAPIFDGHLQALKATYVHDKRDRDADFGDHDCYDGEDEEAEA